MTNIVIVEDNLTLLHSFKEIIDTSPNFNVIGIFTSYEEIENSFDFSKVDILISDIQLPGVNGIVGFKRLKKQHPALIVIIITVHEDSTFVFDALCAGAVGYLIKNIEPIQLISSLEQAKEGGAPMSINIARKVVESFSKKPSIEVLTKRENEILQLLAKGKTYPSIAKELFISLNTVKGHTKKIYNKLQINSKEEIIEKYGSYLS